jgi:hypothetical protein
MNIWLWQPAQSPQVLQLGMLESGGSFGNRLSKLDTFDLTFTRD